MPVPAFSTRLRLGALVLLASALPLVVQVPAAVGPASRAQPAAWLRAHVQTAVEEGATPAPVKQEARAHFEQALAEATAADTRTLHDFLSSFLEAHARLTDAEAPATEGRTTRALLAAFRQQLVQSGLAVRSPLRMSAPPTAPSERARWMSAAASLLVPLPDRSPVAVGVEAFPPPSRALALAASVTGRVAPPVACGPLFRALFGGRRLGP